MSKVKASAVKAYSFQFLSLKESPPNSNNIFFNTEYYGHPIQDGTPPGVVYPWCATCWSIIFRRLNASNMFLGGQLTDSCAFIRNYAIARGQWVTSGYRLGDLVIYDWERDGRLHTDHVGFVVGVNVDGTLQTYEGNTGIGNDSNGGEFMERTRSTVNVIGAYRPDYAPEDSAVAPSGTSKGTTMNIVQGSTTDEIKMIDGIQKSIGAVVDGEIGTQTMSDIASLLKADCFPLTLQIYGMPVIIANDLVIASPHAGVGGFDYSMTGGFNNGDGPCSICVIDGQVICGTACHSAYGCPETVIYRIKGGPIETKRVMNVDELPANVWWAMGGLGGGPAYDPVLEGFKKMPDGKDFSDVIRDTDHCMVGVKNNHTYQVFCKSMTGAQVNAFGITLGLEKYVIGDGGSWAAINGSEPFAQINLDHPQLFIVQGVKQ